MKVFSTAAVFLCVIGAAAFAQSTSVQQVGSLAYRDVNHSIPGMSFGLGMFAYRQSTAVSAATSHGNASLIGQVLKHSRSSASLGLWPSAYPSYGTPSGFRRPAPFMHSSSDHGSRCLSGALEPFQVASCIGLPGFDKAAINRLENMAAHFMRHYNWQGNMGVNRACVRSLSCSSVYERSVLQRMAVRPPN